ncbi:MAG: alpha/beta hydrolase [Casimicrobiaceae bacterium]
MTRSSPTAVPSTGWSERGISILNGVVGDYLDRRSNGLAIPMSFVHEGAPLIVNAHALKVAQPVLTGKVVVLVHGWCCNEDVWRFPGDGATYATKLQRDAGYTPFAARYNTGMPVAESGAALDQHLTALVKVYPCPVETLVLVGHSMGGLVLRSACEHGARAGAAWLPHVRHAFYLGTPHDGADLERFAHGATEALASTRNPVTRLIGRVLGVRSAGVKDLRGGGTSSTASGTEPLATVPWLATAKHHRLVGTLTDNPRHPVSKVLGDGLVRVPGGSADGNAMAAPDVTVFTGVHHLQLARDPAVYTAILAACSSA